MKLYLVRWLYERYYHHTGFRGGLPDCPATPRLVKAFTDPLAAEEYRRDLEQGGLAPPLAAFVVKEYGYCGLGNLTSLPEPAFEDWVRDCGLEPPQEAGAGQSTGRDWATWWKETAPRMTPEQRAHVWRALDRIRFFEVVETELEV
jgi:hypothetical protein